MWKTKNQICFIVYTYRLRTFNFEKFKIPTKILGTFAIALGMLGFVLYLVYKPETQSFFTGKPVQEKQGIQKELEQQQVSELDKKVVVYQKVC